MFRFDEEIQLSYPTSTHLKLWRPDACNKRLVIVKSVRDLLAEPLTVTEFMRRPFLLRSRYLIRAFEPSTNQWRQFYLGSSKEFRSPSVLRIGLYEPGDDRPFEMLGGQFEPTMEDRHRMIKLLREWSALDTGAARLRVFANDLRVVS